MINSLETRNGETYRCFLIRHCDTLTSLGGLLEAASKRLGRLYQPDEPGDNETYTILEGEENKTDRYHRVDFGSLRNRTESVSRAPFYLNSLFYRLPVHI
jgi:hypothetical protein